jgi:hypothetical protein
MGTPEAGSTENRDFQGKVDFPASPVGAPGTGRPERLTCSLVVLLRLDTCAFKPPEE